MLNAAIPDSCGCRTPQLDAVKLDGFEVGQVLHKYANLSSSAVNRPAANWCTGVTDIGLKSHGIQAGQSSNHRVGDCRVNKYQVSQ
ncbi:hypothetical protein BGZ74_008648, partial [Mortierella antarctica]